MKKQSKILLLSLCLYTLGFVDYFSNLFDIGSFYQILLMILPAALYIRKFADRKEEFFTFEGFVSLTVTLLLSALFLVIVIAAVIIEKYSKIDCLPYAMMCLGFIFLCLQTLRAVKIKI